MISGCDCLECSSEKLTDEHRWIIHQLGWPHVSFQHTPGISLIYSGGWIYREKIETEGIEKIA